MKTIYPVIVIYKTSIDEAASYNTLIKPSGIEAFLVYDNSPASYAQKQFDLPPEATYVRDVNNSGLSGAYNMGAALARQKGYKRVLLLDQDTVFAPDTWSEYQKHIDYPGITAPVIITNQGCNFSPVDITGLNLKAAVAAKPGEISLYARALANSGCCIPISLYEKAGGYNEKVRLDFADFQFLIYVRKHFSKALLLACGFAEQDFSNDCKDCGSMLNRFTLYLDSAKYFDGGSFFLNFKHHYLVFRHTLSLTLRTHNLQFFSMYLKEYVFSARK